MKRNWKLTACVAILLGLVTVAEASEGERPEVLAQRAAESWLALVDSGKYAESWDAAAGAFKSNVTKEQWVEAAQRVRGAVGDLKSRKLMTARYTKALPNAPEGEYVVLKFDASFAELSSGVETVIPTLDKDDRWRVSGYFVREK